KAGRIEQWVPGQMRQAVAYIVMFVTLQRPGGNYERGATTSSTPSSSKITPASLISPFLNIVFSLVSGYGLKMVSAAMRSGREEHPPNLPSSMGHRSACKPLPADRPGMSR